MKPSAASRSAFFEALAMPRSRSRAAALSRSPAVSVSAFLTSIMPAPVMARSFLMFSIVTAISFCLSCLFSFTQGLKAPFNPGAPALLPGSSGGFVSVCGRLGGGSGLSGSFLACFVRFGRLGLGCGSAVFNRIDAGGLADGLFGRGELAGRRGFGTGRRGLSGSSLRGGFSAVGATSDFHDQVSQAGGDQLDGADGVIVAGDDVVEQVRVAVGIGQCDDRDVQLVGF